MSQAEPTEAFINELTRSLEAQAFVKLTLSKPRRTVPGVEAPPEQAFARLIEIKKEPHLSFILRYTTKDITTNYPAEKASEVVAELLRSSFHNAHLFTTIEDLDLRANNKGVPRLYRHKPTFTEAQPQTHDRVKQYVLDPAKAPYLRELGIASADGHIKSDKTDKYRQLQNIIKLLDQFSEGSALRKKSKLRVVDMGCGKAYLTFALYDYCNHHLGIETEVLGIDQNEALVNLCNGIAQKLSYKGLRFRCSKVEASEVGPMDLLVALHACDTATDAALYQGVAAGASMIIAVPCCQKELRPQFKSPPEEQPLFKHDTFKDRFSQMLTDSLRGLLMESQGYRTQVIEFISDAHTHRNVMIVAVRDEGFTQSAARLSEASALMDRYHIAHQQLATLLKHGGRLAL
jgi:SAM-dependent methyltransferase